MAATQQQDTGMAELVNQAVETFGGAVRAGVKLQSDFARLWTDALGQVGTIHEWQKKSQAVLSDAIPTAQKNADEAIKLVDQNYRSGMELLKKAIDSSRAQTADEAARRAEALWDASMDALRNNTQAVAAANIRAMESWADFLRKSFDLIEKPSKASK